jgi:ABC-type lipoprotein export system ATPase subunit
MVTHNPELAQRAHRQIHVVDGQIDHIHQFKSRTASQSATSVTL